ncbi:MAG: hypothetical protein H0X31_08025 [Nostocaceae cyanobacterium]|nr:hypothetical protein [Nostocaceae cyanobacterium]
MEEFKTPPGRLVRLFQRSRENWKETAIERHKKLRASEIKIRDLSLSRENWKKWAQDAEKELRLLRTQLVDGEKKGKNFHYKKKSK